MCLKTWFPSCLDMGLYGKHGTMGDWFEGYNRDGSLRVIKSFLVLGELNMGSSKNVQAIDFLFLVLHVRIIRNTAKE